MVSSNAAESIQWLFEKALSENIQGSIDLVHRLQESIGFHSRQAIRKNRLFVISIASYQFKIVTLFEFDHDHPGEPNTRDSDVAQTSFVSSVVRRDPGEFVNMICGSVNRALGEHFPSIGMSTPFQVDASCSDHIHALNPAMTKVFDVCCEHHGKFRVAACVCLTKSSRMDFKVRRDMIEEQVSGELEFF
jgi:hypothetical protein